MGKPANGQENKVDEPTGYFLFRNKYPLTLTLRMAVNLH
jgi:hypothetical protein